MNRRGFSVRPAKTGPGSIEDGVEFLKSCEIIIHPRCERTAIEFGLYSYKVDKLTGEVITNQLGEKHNHFIDSTRYALERTRRGRTSVIQVRTF